LAPVGEQRFFSLFPSGSREPSFLEDAALDLDGDGKDEWLVPMPTGYAVHNAEGAAGVISCDVDSVIRSGSGMYVRSQLPAYHAFAIEGQKHQALAFLTDESADFAYGENWSERRRFIIPERLGEKWEASAHMHDIDGDGMPDLVVTQTQGTINLEVVTQVFLASAPMTYPDEPSARFKSKGSFAAPFVKDVDGDDRLDLVFINIPWGVRFFVNLFVFRKLGVELEVFVFKDGGFSTKPDFKAGVSIDAPEGREQSAYAMGDFNGDGRADIVFGEGRSKMSVHTGSADRFISSKPWVTVEVAAFGQAHAHDVNGNEADDIVIHHPGIEDAEYIEVVVF
jgi:hypothetical protein